MAENKVTGVWRHAGEGYTNNSIFRYILLPLGLLGPIIGAAMGIILVIIGLWLLKFTNVIVMSQLISLFIAAVERNLALIFAFFLFTGFCEYFARNFKFTSRVLLPAAGAAGFTFSLFALGWILRTLGNSLSVPLLSQAGSFLREYLIPIFALSLILGIISFRFQ